MAEIIIEDSYMPTPLRAHVAGRLRNIGRPKHWLMAVAEGIKNAMDSLEESGTGGSIKVEIERGADLATVNGTKPVKEVSITDQGVGFNDAHFESFCTPDTLLKSARGGKGLGRLVYLQVFERVEVSSVYETQNGFFRREFIFQGTEPELRQRSAPWRHADRRTEVRLMNLRPELLSAALPLAQITEWLREHFLPALLERPRWLKQLTIKDGDDEKDLTDMISAGAVWSESFKIKTYQFSCGCHAVQSSARTDQVRFVAAGRTVDANTRELAYYFPHLSELSDEKCHVILVRSPFFDEHVNDARNGISFSEEGEEAALLGITAAQFREALANALRAKVMKQLERSDAELKKRIEALVKAEAPFYRPLLSGYYEGREFGELSSVARDDEILASLDAYKRREVAILRRESRRLAKLYSTSAEYVEAAQKLAAQIETQRKVALAEYVSLRRIVLDRLEQLLGAKKDGKAYLEEAVHNLVFPQKMDSESHPGVEHQLWILDERLESHNYVSSDRPLDGLHGDRPDLLIALDRPGAFASDSSPKAKGYERIALVEFKRALKDLTGVPTDDLPHRQMMRYAHQIREGKTVHVGSGRPIKTAENVRFYLYAVCELPVTLLDRLYRDEGFTPSPTGDGAFAVKNEGRYYLEYLSVEKVLEDAKARNQAFFERLGLES